MSLAVSDSIRPELETPSSAQLGFSSAAALARREIVRFLRQRNRVIGAIGTPLLFWLFFGTGLDRSFHVESPDAAPAAAVSPGPVSPDAMTDQSVQATGTGSPAGPTGPSVTAVQRLSFSDYYLPGSLVLIVLFTAIFATISVIEDRREGVLQGVLVSPAPRWGLALGKILGGSVLAIGQGMLFLVVACVILGRFPWLGLLLAIPLTAITAAGMTSIGLALAWRTSSVQGFHAVMNLILMPLWLLSGAFFPAPPLDEHSTIGQTVLHYAIVANPVSYAVAGARHLLAPPSQVAALGLPDPWVCWAVVTVAALGAFALAWRTVARPTTSEVNS